MRADFVLRELATADIEQMSTLAVEAFGDDSYFKELFGKDNLEVKLHSTFKECASICLNCGKVVGAFDASGGEMVSFALMFDFNALRERHYHHYQRRYPVKQYRLR